MGSLEEIEEHFLSDASSFIEAHKKTTFVTDPDSAISKLEKMLVELGKRVNREVDAYGLEYKIPEGATDIQKEIYTSHEISFYERMDNLFNGAISHVALLLKKIGEGYLLLERLGYPDPFHVLGIGPIDYISSKCDIIEELLEGGVQQSPDAVIGAVSHHLREIDSIGRKYEIAVFRIPIVREAAARFIKRYPKGVESLPLPLGNNYLLRN